MFDELILHGDQIHQKTVCDAKNVVIPVRLPWYRNLALCVLQSLNFTIDGRKYLSKADEVQILLDGETVSIQEISTAPRYKKIVWCNLDVQNAVISLDAPLMDGPHKVEMEMCINLPYAMPLSTKVTESGEVKGDSLSDPEQLTGFPQFAAYEKTMWFRKGEN